MALYRAKHVARNTTNTSKNLELCMTIQFYNFIVFTIYIGQIKQNGDTSLRNHETTVC